MADPIDTLITILRDRPVEEAFAAIVHVIRLTSPTAVLSRVDIEWSPFLLGVQAMFHGLGREQRFALSEELLAKYPPEHFGY